MRTKNGWVIDNRNNRASIERWGSEEKAAEILRSLDNCYRCSDCYGCSRCYGCSDCSRCSECSRCSRCYGCYGFYGCSDCYGCYPQKIKTPVPVIEDIHKKLYAAVSQPNALEMSTWHTCETTHCRAGWVVTLAGAEGKKLEQETTPLFAAQQIYKASGYDISPVRFFDSNEAAMADMKRLAEAME
jgi:uncharacterized pyridoxamine 5'-phosphate oxidase family protein